MNLPLNTGLNIALFGGTFDPIHRGHLHLIQQIAPKFDLIMIIPAASPQLKSNVVVASASQRLEMCELALEDLPEDVSSRVVVNDIEIERDGATYTYDTLHQLRGFFPRDNFTLIIGSDAASNFSQWKRSKDIKNMAQILVIKRPSAEKSEFKEIEIDALEISATQIREEISLHGYENLENSLSPQVLEYIKKNHLYSSQQNGENNRSNKNSGRGLR